MIKFLLRSYTSIMSKRKNARSINKTMLNIQRVLILYCARILIPIYLKTNTKGETNHRNLKDLRDGGGKIVVSLTSFPVRFKTLWIVIELLLRQSVRPDVIVLYLSKDEVPTLDTLPKTLLSLQKRGLEIRLVEGNLRSHKKYYYAMQEYPNDLVITVDDDIYYPQNLIESLIETHRKNPKAIIANKTQQLSYDENGALLPYTKWRKSQSGIHMQTGIGGVLYPPRSLYKDLLNDELFMQLSPRGDDLWLYAMAKLNNTSVLKSNFAESYMEIKIAKDIRLCHSNVAEGHNDMQIKNIRHHYIRELGIDPFSKA